MKTRVGKWEMVLVALGGGVGWEGQGGQLHARKRIPAQRRGDGSSLE